MQVLAHQQILSVQFRWKQNNLYFKESILVFIIEFLLI